jgi:hypothetical protein
MGTNSPSADMCTASFCFFSIITALFNTVPYIVF